MISAPTREQSSSKPADVAQAEMILSQIESLPTLPSVAIRLLELTSDPSSGAREVVRLVESDQSIAARILSLARKANLGVNATTAERAVVLLGLDAVRCLVLSMQVFEFFTEQGAKSVGHLDIPGLWRHSLAVACCARLLADETSRAPRDAKASAAAPAKPTQPEEAFLCGLLHDIGKVALHVCFPKSYDRVVRGVETTHGSIIDQEREVFGLDHTTAGRRLAMHWRLPEMISESIWLHHHNPSSTPTRISFPQHVRLVQLADLLARQMHIGYSGNHALESPGEWPEVFGFSREALDRVSGRLPELMEERAELIGLDRLTSRELYQGALVAANSELGRTNARLLMRQRDLEQRSRTLQAVAELADWPGGDTTHEEILKSAANGLARLYPGQSAAVITTSPVRGLLLISVAGETHECVCEAQPFDDTDAMPQPRQGHAWVHASLLGPAWVDRLAGLLGKAPLWCWAMRHERTWRGAFVLTEPREMEPEADSGIDLLARLTARWLEAAESSVHACQLHEELADINRRLLSAQAQVARMRSLSMVGEMAAGAAHELNNPLAVISGRAQILDREGLGDEVRKNAALIREHAHRASQLVTELMEFAKPAAPSPDTLDLQALLGQIRRSWIEKGALTDAQFELHLSDDLPRAWADESQMHILFDELIRNAVEAIAGVPQARLVVNCQLHPTDESIVIRITDNGRGMSREVQERAATPFYSSRPAGRGRGLGLSRAVRYAEINGGQIQLTSRPGHGTEVVVELPASAS